MSTDCDDVDGVCDSGEPVVREHEDLCEGAPLVLADTARQMLSQITNGWAASPVKLARYTNGLLLIGVLVSMIFHGEVAYALFKAHSGLLNEDQMMEITYKLAIWAGIHQIPIALHGGGTIALRGYKTHFNDVQQWRARPWLYGSEIFAISFLVSIMLLLWATHVTGTVPLMTVILLDLIAEAIIWGGVRYIKDHKAAIALLAKIAGIVPQFIVRKP